MDVKFKEASKSAILELCKQAIDLEKKHSRKKKIADTEIIQQLVSDAKKRIKEIHLFYGILKQSENLESSKNGEIDKVIINCKKELLALKMKHEAIDLIDWDVESSIHTTYKKWCSDKNLDYSRYETLDKYFNQ